MPKPETGLGISAGLSLEMGLRGSQAQGFAGSDVNEAFRDYGVGEQGSGFGV